LAHIEKIIVAGSSFGSYLACLLSQARPVAALALRVPADYPDAGFDDPQLDLSDTINMGKWRMAERHDYTLSISALRNFAGPVLIVESGRDEILPHSTTERFVKAANPSRLTYEVMVGAAHSLNSSTIFREQFAGILSGWLRRIQGVQG
jgi:uncharacterized protein